jgi:hypothetical protein
VRRAGLAFRRDWLSGQVDHAFRRRCAVDSSHHAPSRRTRRPSGPGASTGETPDTGTSPQVVFWRPGVALATKQPCRLNRAAPTRQAPTCSGWRASPRLARSHQPQLHRARRPRTMTTLMRKTCEAVPVLPGLWTADGGSLDGKPDVDIVRCRGAASSVAHPAIRNAKASNVIATREGCAGAPITAADHG